MSRYTVVWSDEAQEQLAQFWLDADDRGEITAASHAIDRELATDPRSKGYEVSEGIRGLDVPPLRALFVVSEPDQLARVVMVRLFLPPETSNGAAGHP